MKRSQILEIAMSCSWWMVSGASLTAKEENLRAHKIISSADTVG